MFPFAQLQPFPPGTYVVGDKIVKVATTTVCSDPNPFWHPSTHIKRNELQ